MSTPILADDFVARVRDLERRLSILERTARVPQITTTDLGLQVDAEATLDTTTSTTYTDLDTTAGPSVDVVIGQSGRAVVFVAAQITHTTGDSGWMAFEVTGPDASTRPADDAEAVLVAGNASETIRLAAVALVDGLAPGVNTFTAKYRASIGANPLFELRTIVVVPL